MRDTNLVSPCTTSMNLSTQIPAVILSLCGSPGSFGRDVQLHRGIEELVQGPRQLQQLGWKMMENGWRKSIKKLGNVGQLIFFYRWFFLDIFRGWQWYTSITSSPVKVLFDQRLRHGVWEVRACPRERGRDHSSQEVRYIQGHSIGCSSAKKNAQC